jgi:hypothetical protein
MRPNRGIWLGLAVLLGCQEVVELGTQCPPGSACSESSLANASDAGVGVNPSADSSVPRFVAGEAGSDGGMPMDGLPGDAATGGSAVFPDIRNPSFEVTSGQGGDLAVIDISVNQPGIVDPWRACQLVNFNSGDTAAPYTTVSTAVHSIESSTTVGSGASATTVHAADRDSFLAMSYPGFIPSVLVVIPISQALGTPLVAGTRYAFAVKLLRVDPTRDYSLRVYGSGEQCLPASSPWAEVAVPAASDWQTACVEFTASTDASYLMLAAGTSYVGLAPANNVTAFLVDDIHPEPGCGATGPS